jgi:hypothetical protein
MQRKWLNDTSLRDDKMSGGSEDSEQYKDYFLPLLNWPGEDDNR